MALPDISVSYDKAVLCWSPTPILNTNTEYFATWGFRSIPYGSCGKNMRELISHKDLGDKPAMGMAGHGF